MGNWWIDESAPTPGPDYNELTWAEIVEHYKRAFGRASRASTVVWHVYSTGFTAALDEATRVAKTATEAISGMPTPPDRSDKRAWALYCQQNRNTGPRSDINFDRDGRRLR